MTCFLRTWVQNIRFIDNKKMATLTIVKIVEA